MTAERAPDRPIPAALVPVRSIVRRARLTALRARSRGRLQVGENVWFGAGAVLAMPDFASFADNVAVGRDFHLEANLTVGADVLISSRVSIVGDDHPFDDPATGVFWQGRAAPATVVIDGDNLIGLGTIIVGPVRIGRGCIVGAGSVVTRDLPANSVCVGAPARPIRARHLHAVPAQEHAC
jgi:acetyltransferase-like isoleucine patch superfamily enzyme